jgi:hypothetical protein
MIVQIFEGWKFWGLAEIVPGDTRVAVSRTAWPSPDNAPVVQDLVKALEGYIEAAEEPNDPEDVVDVTNYMMLRIAWLKFDGTWDEAMADGREKDTGVSIRMGPKK